MNEEEAIRLLERELDVFRRESHAQLASRIDSAPVVCERLGQGGARYQVEIQFFQDRRAGGNVRVMGSIDDGRWSAIRPITRSFIKAVDGLFVGE